MSSIPLRIIKYQNKFYFNAILIQLIALLWLPLVLQACNFSPAYSICISLLVIIPGITALLVWRFYFLIPEKKIACGSWYFFFLPAFCWQACALFFLPGAVVGLLLVLAAYFLPQHLTLVDYYWKITFILSLLLGSYSTLFARMNLRVKKKHLASIACRENSMILK